MIGKCGLCGKSDNLCESHIIPKFVICYIKDTSITGRLRNTLSPNIALQDGPKYPIFCNSCEQILSIEEKLFAKNIFLPYHLGRADKFEYDFHIGRFCAIQTFRYLIFEKYHREFIEDCDRKTKNILDEAITYLRCFIFNNWKTQNNYNNYLIFLDHFYSPVMGLYTIPERFNFYLYRSIDSTIVTDKFGRIFVYNKIAKMLIITSIKPKNIPDFHKWRIFSNGNIDSHDKEIPDHFFTLLIERAKLINDAYSNLSEKQRYRITEEFVKNQNKIFESESTKAYLADERLKISNK
jgi:hypothetical protein